MATRAGHLRFCKFKACGTPGRLKSLIKSGATASEPDRPSQAQIASEFEMTENAVKQAFYRFRQRYQALLREQISHTVAMPGDIEDELRHLIAVRRA
jgi:hypothetical protein